MIDPARLAQAVEEIRQGLAFNNRSGPYSFDTKEQYRAAKLAALERDIDNLWSPLRFGGENGPFSYELSERDVFSLALAISLLRDVAANAAVRPHQSAKIVSFPTQAKATKRTTKKPAPQRS